MTETEISTEISEWISDIPSTREDVWTQVRKSLPLGRISRDTYLRELYVIINKPNRFCYYVQNEEF